MLGCSSGVRSSFWGAWVFRSKCIPNQGMPKLLHVVHVVHIVHVTEDSISYISTVPEKKVSVWGHGHVDGLLGPWKVHWDLDVSKVLGREKGVGFPFLHICLGPLCFPKVQIQIGSLRRFPEVNRTKSQLPQGQKTTPALRTRHH